MYPGTATHGECGGEKLEETTGKGGEEK